MTWARKNDGRDLLTVLRDELEYLERGGYHTSAQASWRPQFIFEDSPTCLNSDLTKPRRPCSDCVITAFVPDAAASKKFPCRFIPLNEQGETVDSYHRSGTREELEKSLATWLRKKIKERTLNDARSVP
jgi:hypothetical protein